MGLGDWLARSRVYTVTDTLDPEFLETYTINGTPLLAPDWGEGQAYRGGMQIPGAWRAATMRADQIGKFPFHLYRERAGQTTERVKTPLFLLQPAPPRTRMTTMVALALDLIWHGNAIALIVSRNADGTPAAMQPINAERVSIARQSNGRLAYRIGEGKVFDEADVLHVMGHSRADDLRGMGVLEQHFATLDASRGLSRQSNAVVHGVPTGILEASDPDTTVEELKSGKASWIAAQSTRTIAALPPGVKFTPISWDPSQMQLIEARKFDLTQLALIFGIPGYWLGAESTGFTYSSAEWEGRNLLKYTAVGSDLERFEQTLSLLYPHGKFVRANRDAMLAGSTAERYSAHQVALAAGFLTIDEVRELENRPPLPQETDPPAIEDDETDPTEEL